MKNLLLVFSVISAIVLCSIISTNAKVKKAAAENRSSLTTCAEEDNVNVPLKARRLKQFQVIAKHPSYAVGVDNCGADFSGCSASKSETALAIEPCQKLYDDGITVIQVCTEQSWWRPFVMNVQVSNMPVSGHRLVISRKIEGEASWPQVMVLYEDGNMRLKPHPPKGQSDVCFGSSVVIGPAAPSTRPFVDIQEIRVDAVTQCLDISYRSAGTAHVCISVDRTQAVADVEVEYDISESFATFRSMWVQDGNADADHIQTPDGDFAILGEWTTLRGTSWLFHRKSRSNHNTSAPDVSIEALR
jgi:hypothetical protein